MGKEMLTLNLDPKNARLADVCQKLKLHPRDIDQDFGVVNIDPKKNLYTVLVESEVARKAGQLPGVQGPYSNPKIEAFGPPQKSGKPVSRS